jgi:hypothetical protein
MHTTLKYHLAGGKMVLKKSAILCALSIIYFTNIAFAQIQFNAHLTSNDIKSFFIRDLTGDNPTVQFFNIFLENTYDIKKSCIISIDIKKGINDDPVGYGETFPFDLLPPNGTIPSNPNEVISPITITNKNLFSSFDQTFNLKGGFDITGIGDELQNQILATGRLPSDLYKITIGLETEADVIPQKSYELILDIRVSGSQKVDLKSPGSENYDPIDEIFTTYPYFQWNSGLTKFKLVISERPNSLPGIDHFNPEEILKSRIIFEKVLQLSSATETIDAGAVLISNNSFQYLENKLLMGRTYYYQIIGLQGSTSGDGFEEIPSEIWAFKIKNTAETESADDTETDVVTQSLKRIPGLHPLSYLFQPGGELQGFRLNNIFHNGKSISKSELFILLSDLNSKGKAITNLSIDDVPRQ